jgi:hypothetical protein
VNRWAAHLPLVTIAHGSTPTSVTLIYPYYCCPQFFAQQVDGWSRLSWDVRRHVSAIVVDDGSPEPAQLPATVPFPIRLFRIHEDRRWNWLAARNIGMLHAPDGKCLLSDMDHVVPEETLRAAIYGLHDPATVYAFSRREHTGETIPAHSASFLMTRALFWTIGGYDEALSGHYGTDGEFRRRIAQHASIHVLTDTLIRHEFQSDASTTRYLRKQPEDAAVQQLIAARTSTWRPRVLSFPYSEVASCSP